MNFPRLIASLSTYFAMPFLELPGAEAQFKLAPGDREELIRKFPNLDYQKSAVLILLYPNQEGEACMVFTKRNHYPGVHSGQISFPGGKFEEQDINVIQTAIRETTEEIGVTIENAKVLGRLSNLKIPVSKFEVFPVLGYTNETPTFVKDESEVEKIIEIPLSVLNSLSPEIGIFQGSSGMRLKAPYLQLYQEKLWGATAMITSEFLEIVRMNYR